jgi:hydantoinase/carbamoylase family amidase
VAEAGLRLDVDLEAIDFTDEEGSLCSFLGSQAFAGHLRLEDLEAPRGGRDALDAGLQRAGLSREGVLSAPRLNPAHDLAGYVELHIEQGKRLEQAGMHIGIVSAIPGIGLYRLHYLGRADHAGAVPLDERRDAALGAGAFLLAYHQVVLQDFPGCFANVGQIALEPGMFNIVPERASLALEYRALDEAQFARLEAALLACAREQAQQFDLGFEAGFIGKHPAAPMTPVVQNAIAAASAALGLASQVLPSRAGHDGQSLAGLCPVGMIFVPSVGGSSHSAAEFTRWEDCVNGANVLLQTALRLAFI